MKKFMLGCVFSVISIAIASTTSVTSVKAQTSTSVDSGTIAEYIDTTTPQVIEKISGNIVTFKNAAGESNNYYVPSWMFEKYDLKVGTSANLYNRNVIQGIYRDRYIDVLSQGLPDNLSAFAILETERHCTTPASEGLGSGMRVWYRAGDCPSAIPVVGAMSFYQAQPIASSEPSDRRSNTTSDVSPATDASRQEMMRQEMMRNDALRNNAPRTMDRPTTAPNMNR